MPSFFDQVVEVCRHLFSNQELMRLLENKQMMVAAYVVVTLVVFTETGLLVGFFLPGDSLLVTAGIVSYLSGWNLPLLLVIVSIAAIVGDTVGYYIGWRTGPRIFKREKSLLFAKDHLVAAQRFYERHGGKIIILARFVPFLRTFAPVVAGVGRMRYRRFLAFNIFGGIGWVFSMILFGYCLPAFLERWFFKPIFGEAFRIQDHIEKVILIVVFLSICPILFQWRRGRSRGASSEKQNKSSSPVSLPSSLATRPSPLSGADPAAVGIGQL